MRFHLPTFNEFVQFNNSLRERSKKKHQHKILIALYYPFVLMLICLFYWVISTINTKRKSKLEDYRSSDKYKKVIKEGIFFDTIEYHER